MSSLDTFLMNRNVIVNDISEPSCECEQDVSIACGHLYICTYVGNYSCEEVKWQVLQCRFS